MTFTDIEVKAIIDTEVFQRLRYIHQLQLCRLVYSCADHTRFQHSLGVAHLMSLFIDNVIKEYEKELARYSKESLDEFRNIRNELIISARIAALLHDVGHGFLSHFSEIVRREYDHKEIGYLLFEKYFSEKLRDYIRKNYNNTLNEDNICTFVKALLKPLKEGFSVDSLFKNLEAEAKEYAKYLVPFYQILHGWLYTVDELDYLMRDGYFTGTYEYGALDWYRLLQETSVNMGVENEKGEKLECMLLSVKDLRRFLPAYRRFLLAYENMYDTVVFHKTILAFEIGLLLYLCRGSKRDEILGKINSLVTCLKEERCREEELLDNLYANTDDNILREIRSLISSETRDFSDLLKNILSRTPPFKLVMGLFYKVTPPIVTTAGKLMKQNALKRAELSIENSIERVQGVLGTNMDRVLNLRTRKVYAWKLDDVNYGIVLYAIIQKPKAYKYNVEDPIFVVKSPYQYLSLNELTLIAGITGIICKLAIYAKNDENVLNKIVKDLRDSLIELEKSLRDLGYIPIIYHL
ncbi:MAG: HD domain-containing protein [Crenarchaeota archaeon]|nr:HD domain-containing protein [Thermoproteota archaeon]